MAEQKKLAFGNLFGGDRLSGVLSLVTFTLDTTGDRVGMVFCADEDTTVTELGFRFGVRTGTPPTYRISLQALDASGFPDGTVLGGGSPASATFTPPASTAWNSTWQWITLTNSVAISRGQFYAIVIDYSSGTIDAGNRGTFTYSLSGVSDSLGGYGLYTVSDANTGSWSIVSNSGTPVFGYRSASKTFGMPVAGITTFSASSDTTPDELALCWTLNLGTGVTYKVSGLSWNGRTGATGKSFKLILYTGTDVVQTTTVDSNYCGPLNNTDAHNLVYFDETNLTTLYSGSQYRISIQPQETSVGVSLRVLDFGASSDLQVFPGGTSWFYSTRINAGTWTDVGSSRPVASLLLEDITTPAASSGMLYYPGLSGGARG